MQIVSGGESVGQRLSYREKRNGARADVRKLRGKIHADEMLVRNI